MTIYNYWRLLQTQPTSSSSVSQNISVPAGQNTVSGTWMFVAHPTAGYTCISGVQSGYAYPIDTSYRSRSAMVIINGLAQNTVASGNSLSIQVQGVVTVTGGLTPFCEYILSTSGVCLPRVGYYPMIGNPLGLALSTTDLYLYPNRYSGVPGVGLVMGGYNGGFFSNVDAINFSAESLFATGATIGSSVFGASGFWNSLAAYAAGGQGLITAIYKVKFSYSRTTLSATISEGKRGCASVCTNNNGYMLGGDASQNGGAIRTAIEVLRYSNETRSTLSAVISAARYFEGSHVINETKGYVAGGMAGSAVVDAFIFNTETCNALGSSLTSNSNGSAASCSRTKGYCMGGFSSDIVNGMLFSNETWGVVAGATLGSTIRTCGCGVASSIASYALGGGNWSSYVADVTALYYSNETTVLVSSVSSTRMAMAPAIG